MSTLREAFLKNRERYIAVLGDDHGFVPHTESSRKLGMGDSLKPFTPALKLEADRLAGIRVADGAAEAGSHVASMRCPRRMGHLAVLAAAHRGAPDERYVEAAQQGYLDWIAAHPARKDLNWDEIVHGLYAWLGSLHVFLPSRVFRDDTVEKVIAATAGHLDYLAEEIYPARNLRISSAASLLNNSLRLAFLPQAGRWIDLGARVMTDACLRQIRPDGSHLEATPHYHFCTMGDILNVFRKARLLPELKMNIPAELVARLYDYLAAATSPTGWITGIHDGPSQGSNQVRGNGVSDILAERDGFRRSLGLPPEPLPAVQLFPHAGQIFLRDRWTNDATYVTFDASPCWSYHWHPSRNSIQLQAYGRALLVDAGRFSYSDPVWGAYPHQTRIHSTLNLNGWDQAETDAVLRHRAAPGYELVEGLYRGGYWTGTRTTGRREGIYGEHHRALLWIRDRFFVVIDHLLCPSIEGKKPRVESVWQLGEGKVAMEPGMGRVCTRNADANLLMLFPMLAEGMTAAVHEGSENPRRGWLPKEFEKTYVPAPQIVWSVDNREAWSTDLVTILIPFRGTDQPKVTAMTAVEPEKSGDFRHPGYGKVVVRWSDGTTDDIIWTRRLELALNTREGLTTDAALVHLQKNAGGKVTGGLVVDGTYLEPHTKERRTWPGTFSFI